MYPYVCDDILRISHTAVCIHTLWEYTSNQNVRLVVRSAQVVMVYL